MSEHIKSPESPRPDYDELIDRLETMLEASEPNIYLDPVELPFGLLYHPRGATSHRTAEISHDEGYTRLQVNDFASYGSKQPEVETRLHIRGYYVTDHGPFLKGVALWETHVSPDLLDPEDIEHVIACIEGKIPVRSDVFDKFKSPTGAM